MDADAEEGEAASHLDGAVAEARGGFVAQAVGAVVAAIDDAQVVQGAPGEPSAQRGGDSVVDQREAEDRRAGVADRPQRIEHRRLLAHVARQAMQQAAEGHRVERGNADERLARIAQVGFGTVARQPPGGER